MISRHTILYADDDLDDLFMVKKAFEKHDHIQVEHAPNGEEALKLLVRLLDEQKTPCLIILDINMPVLNGRETLACIKTNDAYKNIPVVLFSTSSSPVDTQFAESYKVDLFTKPLHYYDLEKIANLFVDKCNFEPDKLHVSTEAQKQ